MRKMLAVFAVLALGGCQAVREEANEAVATAMTPPSAVLDGLKMILEWVIYIAMNFFTDLAGKIGL